VNQTSQPNQKTPKTNWLFIVVVLLVGLLAGLSILTYQYFQIREELQGQTTQIENLLHLINKLKEKIEDTKTGSLEETSKFIE